MKKTRSPLLWFGGKSKQAKHIISKMPDHKSYIEPFGGAAHVIAQKNRVGHEVYNDIDGIVVNFLMQAIENPEKLSNYCESIPYSRELYERYKREKMPVDPFEKAARFFYLNRSGITKGNAEEVSKTGWRHSTSSNQNPANGYISACEMIVDFSERMKGVMIENADFETIINKYDKENALFYVDPPYIGREKYYAGGFTMNDHRKLGELLNNVKGKVILSYYDDPIINELYGGWNIERHGAYKQAVGGQNVGAKAEELLIMNFSNEQTKLF